MSISYSTGPGFKTCGPPITASRLRAIALFFGMLAFAVGLILLPALAHGQEALGFEDPGQIAQLALQALSVGGAAKWVALALAGVIATVAAVRWFAKGKSARWAVWISSDEGGTVLGWVVSAAGAVVVYLVGGGNLSAGELGAVALGLRAGTAITWSDGRRLLRVVAPLVKLIPKVGPPLASLLDALSGATEKAAIKAETEAAYRAQSPAPTAAEVAAALAKPPVT